MALQKRTANKESGGALFASVSALGEAVVNMRLLRLGKREHISVSQAPRSCLKICDDTESVARSAAER